MIRRKDFLGAHPWLSYLTNTIFLAVVIVYLAVIVSRTAWRNYLIERKVYRLQKEIEVLEEENVYLKNLLAYYRSPSYRERMARLLLNYKKPDEKVIAFPYQTPKTESFKFKFKEEEVDTRSNWQKWIDFILKRS
ncbi:septum formation initiator family protein [bacterium]|nr:septum formation initiator family protein [bacterium]